MVFAARLGNLPATQCITAGPELRELVDAALVLLGHRRVGPPRRAVFRRIEAGALHVRDRRRAIQMTFAPTKDATSARDDFHNMIAIALGAKVAGFNPLCAEAHLGREILDLSGEQLRQPGMSALGAELRLAFAQRHQLAPLLVE